jgi:aryl-alcohol dehydrogenase-like predicted oxidoreductase
MLTTSPAGAVTVADDLALGRMGFGTMQLPGPGVMGPPRDRETALAVLREAVALGVRHIDTADFYGPAVANELIREALHPYLEDLVIVTKVGAVRGEDGSWDHARDAKAVTAQIHRNLRQLRIETLDVVNLRIGGVQEPEEGPLPDGFAALIELQKQGLIRHLGISEATEAQYDEARSMAPVVCVQSNYNLAHREAEHLVQRCAADGIAFVPYFPLGGFTPLQSATLDEIAQRLGASRQQTALAWLLQHSPAIAVIPGTSSLDHLRENVAAANIALSPEDVAALNTIGG